MRAFLALAALALTLGAGTASADTFAVVPEAPEAPAFLPSADTPNEAGSLLLPPGVFAAPFLPVRELSYEELNALWVRAGAAYGIPWQVLAAINKIESNFGRNMGPSSAGAVGWMQFMPDTWLRWGIDGSGDGIADPWNPDDAVHAAARYLAAAGGQTDIAAGDLRLQPRRSGTSTTCSSSRPCSRGGGGADVVFSLDRMAVALEDAEADVAPLAEELRAAQAHQQELDGQADLLRDEASDLALLLSDRLSAEQRRVRGRGRVRRQPRQRSRGSRASSMRPKQRSQPPGAAPTRRRSCRQRPGCCECRPGPTATSSPSAAAPPPCPSATTTTTIRRPTSPPRSARPSTRSPTRSSSRWSTTAAAASASRFRSLDGLEWVYCHLSHRDRAVQEGVVLRAGQWVGLVGSTGNSSGPHLHLGLKPARYPQEMPWFQEFAGLAFTWQDAVASEPVAGPIFAVVPEPDVTDDVVEFTRSGS